MRFVRWQRFVVWKRSLMISNEEIEQVLRETEGVAHVEVAGDGYHYQVTVVSDVFLDKPRVARQQWVYARLKTLITTGQVHALSMKTWTRAEWEKQHG